MDPVERIRRFLTGRTLTPSQAAEIVAFVQSRATEPEPDPGHPSELPNPAALQAAVEAAGTVAPYRP